MSKGTSTSPRRLATRVVSWQTLFTLGSAATLYYLLPFLLLLNEDEAQGAAQALSLAIVLAGTISVAQGWSLVWARRKLLSTLSKKSRRTHHHIELPKLNDDPWQIVNTWLYTSIAAILVSMTLLRPDAISLSQGITLALFSAIILAAASLPLLMLVRKDFVRLMEEVPPDVMAEIIDTQIRSGRLRGRTSRRLLAALATPVAFLGIGAALIAGAHRLDLEERNRLETAARVIPAVLGPGGPERGIPTQNEALKTARVLSDDGYRVTIHEGSQGEVEVHELRGLVDMRVPLPMRTVQILFLGTTEWAVNWRAIPFVLFALLSAVWVGIALARYLSRDLRMANHGVRMLGTDAALEGTRVMRPARFRAVAELGTAIEILGNRFRHFARAQENSISAREAAIRSRGRFFASVSHDLKSPLNAILGFAELSLRDPLTNDAQKESLDMILNRGRELLSLIETILDAARVEAGQLHLEIEDEDIASVLELALDKALDLSSDSDVLTRFDIPDQTPPVAVDRLRCSQAIATFLGHARRTAERGSVRVLVECEPLDERPSLKRRKVTIHIEVPSSQFSAKDLEGMLHPEQHPGQHRGLSLALRLAKSVIELHGGQVTVTGRTVSEPAFAIHLLGRPGK